MPTLKHSERLMKRTKRFSRSWLGAAMAVVLMLLAALSLTGCTDPAAIAAVEPTPTVYPPPPTDIPAPEPGPTPAALSFPLPAPTHVEVESANDETCVQCHTSEEVLKAMAKGEEEVEETLSEGEG
jgi:hypothetical protein